MIAFKPYQVNTKLGLGLRCTPPLVHHSCTTPPPRLPFPSLLHPHVHTTTTKRVSASTPSHSEGPGPTSSSRGDHIIADTSDEEKYLPDDPQGLDEELILDPKVTINEVYKNTKVKKKKKNDDEEGHGKGEEGREQGHGSSAPTTQAVTAAPNQEEEYEEEEEEEYVILDDEGLSDEGLSFQFKAEESGRQKEEKVTDPEGVPYYISTGDDGDDPVKKKKNIHNNNSSSRELLEAMKAKVKKSAEDREPIERINKRVIDAFLDEQARKEHLAKVASAAGGSGGQKVSLTAAAKNGVIGFLDVALGRAAGVGLVAAVISEMMTDQSVLSQLMGRYEGGVMVESALPMAKNAAMTVVGITGMWTVVERMMLSRREIGRESVWIGRMCMGVFVLMVLYETWHSNRPLF